MPELLGVMIVAGHFRALIIQIWRVEQLIKQAAAVGNRISMNKIPRPMLSLGLPGGFKSLAKGMRALKLTWPF